MPARFLASRYGVLHAVFYAAPVLVALKTHACGARTVVGRMLYYIAMNVQIAIAILVSVLAMNPSPSSAKTTPLKIVVDIPFVASLAQELVGPEEVITALVTASDSPHNFSLRPRSVRALQNADLVITVSKELSPNITRAMDNVTDVRTFSLASAPGIEMLPSRGQHDHAKPLNNRSTLALTDQYETMNIDPHIWLSPVNVQFMVEALRDELISIAPQRAKQFRESAQRITTQLQAFDEQQQNRWKQATNRSFVSLHDATHYFENRYQLQSKGSLFAATHTSPGVQQLKLIKDIIDAQGISCVVADALTSPAWIKTLSEGFDVTIVSIDVLGFEPNDAHYLTTLNQVADAFAQCLSVASE